MNKKIRFFLVIIILVAIAGFIFYKITRSSNPSLNEPARPLLGQTALGGAQAGDRSNQQIGLEQISQAYAQKNNLAQVQAVGQIQAVLPDETEQGHYQRLVLELGNGMRVLIKHNTDLGARIENVNHGGEIEFKGSYQYNEQGGVIEHTYANPKSEEQSGWIKYEGHVYQ